MKKNFRLASVVSIMGVALVGSVLALYGPAVAVESAAASAAAGAASGDTCCPPAAAGQEKEPRDPNRLWCGEHGKYEDECDKCHPELAKTKGSEQGGVLLCGEHNLPEAECGNCRPELLTELPAGKGLKVRLPSAESAAKVGVALGLPTARSIAPGTSVLGAVSYDRNRLAVITPIAEGIVREVFADVGAFVETGGVLAEMISPEVAEAKGAFVKALAEEALLQKTYEREKGLQDQKISARQDFEAAKTACEVSRSDASQARQRLSNLGLTDVEIEETARTRDTSATLSLRAPFAVTVVEREAVIGALAQPGTPLFRVADLTQMWLDLSIPEGQAVTLEPETPVVARFDSLPGEEFEGTLTWIAYSVDPHTRMVQARAVLPNPGGKLKNGMFGHARLASREKAAQLSLPEDSVQIVDGKPIVFTKIEDDLFESRVVETGPREDGYIAVLAGLSPDENVVLDGSYFLKSELLKSRLGAGCGGDD